MREKTDIILQKIKEYDHILIFRHSRPDGDCTGATKGLQRILKLTFPEKEIYLQNNDFSDYLRFLGEEDEPLPDDYYESALGIVVDTGTSERVSNGRYKLCRETIKIDHHIPVDSYADYEWVEEHRSSACEMITAFYTEYKDELKIDNYAATCLYTGMVTDSGRFRYRSVSGETMRLAGELIDLGIDIDRIYAHLYLKELSELRYESYVHSNMKLSENGVASVYISKEVQKEYELSHEQSSTAVSFMDCIKGALIWLAFIENEDGSIRVRLRSRFITINKLAEKYRGGGHDVACGATVYNFEEMNNLISDADAMLKEFKATNEDWL